MSEPGHWRCGVRGGYRLGGFYGDRIDLVPGRRGSFGLAFWLQTGKIMHNFTGVFTVSDFPKAISSR